MPSCVYCGREIPPGIGLMYVLRTGKVLWFCSRKCKVYALERKRKPEKTRWTSAYYQAKLRKTRH